MAARRVVMHFPAHQLDKPVTSTMTRKFDLEFNIMRASISPQQEGVMVVGFEGTEQNLDDALQWAAEQGVRIEPMEAQIVRNEEKCTECGACITVCPTGALSMDLETRHVKFDPDKCIACELCVPACPPRAMEVKF
ncbi:MAG: 4Fe-4S binding protein [Armatimonadota bacterium]